MTTPSPDYHQWITHKPGDPMPCNENTKIFISLSNGMQTQTPMKAKQWNWEDGGIASIVGWRYAGE